MITHPKINFKILVLYIEIFIIKSIDIRIFVFSMCVKSPEMTHKKVLFKSLEV